MNASCCSVRRTSRTRKIVLRTRPAITRGNRMRPSASSRPSRQLMTIQLTFSATATATRQMPSVAKTIDLRFGAVIMWLGCHMRSAKWEVLSGSAASELRCLGCLSAFAALLALDGDQANAVGHADQLQQADLDPGEVELVPGQAVTRRGRVRVVVVVPALAEGQDGDPPA